MENKKIIESLVAALSSTKCIQESTAHQHVYAEASSAQVELEEALLEIGIKFDDATGEPILED